jgi:hypothetical protein
MYHLVRIFYNKEELNTSEHHAGGMGSNPTPRK